MSNADRVEVTKVRLRLPDDFEAPQITYDSDKREVVIQYAGAPVKMPSLRLLMAQAFSGDKLLFQAGLCMWPRKQRITLHTDRPTGGLRRPVVRPTGPAVKSGG